MNECKGMNCGATDGVSHSPECHAEHAATVAGGVFTKSTAQPEPAAPSVAPEPVAWIGPDYFTAFSKQGFQVSQFKIAPGLVPLFTHPPRAPSVAPEPLFLLHSGQIDSGGEQDDWETEADSQVRVDEFCRLHPGKTIPLFAHPPRAPLPEPAASADPLAGMSEMNRTIAYSAASKLREIGYEWTGKEWAAPSVAPEPWVDTTVMRKLASVLLPVSEKALTECCDEIDRLRTHPSRALLTDADLKRVYEKVSNQSLRPQDRHLVFAFGHAVIAADRGISAAAIGEKP